MRKTKKGLALALSLLLALSFAACGPTDEGDKPKADPTITAVQIAGGNKELPLGGEGVTLTASVTGTGDFSKEVTWNSSDETVATVAGGVVSPLKIGTTTVTATSVADNTKSGSVSIKVYRAFLPQNGGFEEAMPAWGVWTNGDGDIAAERVSEQKYEGERSMKVTNTGNYTVIWQGFLPGEIDITRPGAYIGGQAYVYIPAEVSGAMNANLIIEKFVNDTDKQELARSANVTIPKGEWFEIKTPTAQVPEYGAVDIINVKIEVHGEGVMYVDNVDVKEAPSNNVNLSALTIGGVQLESYTHTMNAYTYYYDGELPVLAASAQEASTVVTVTQPNEENNFTGKIELNAEDGAARVITVAFSAEDGTTLKEIKIDGVAIGEFSPERLHYYKLLASGAEAVPTVTATAVAPELNEEIVVTPAQSTNGKTTITASNGETSKIYEVQFETKEEGRYNITLPDFSMESATLANMGSDGNAALSNTYANSGHKSLKLGKVSEGVKGAWINFDIINKTDALKIGMWIFVDGNEPSGSLTMEFNAQEPRQTLLSGVSVSLGTLTSGWNYFETDSTTLAVTAAQTYYQFVIKTSSTNADVYVDDIRFVKTGDITGGEEASPDETPDGFTVAYETDFDTLPVIGNWGADYQLTTAQVKNGTNSLGTTDAAQYSGFKITLNIGEQINVGDTVKFGVWIYIDPASAGSNVIAKLSYNGDAYITHQAATVKGGWQWIECQTTVLEGKTELWLVIANEGEGAMTYYVDGIRLFTNNAGAAV